MEPKAYIQSTYHYDAQGQIKSQSSIGKDGLNLTQTIQRDLIGDVIQNTLSNTSGETHNGDVYTYDAAGQIVKICDKLGQCEDILYYSSGQLQSISGISGNITTYRYDNLGRLLL